MTNDIQKTILAQINWRDLILNGFQIVALESEDSRHMSGIRIHKFSKHRSLDIYYDEGKDLYVIQKIKINKDLTVEIKWVDDVYVEDLEEFICTHFNIAHKCAEMMSE